MADGLILFEMIFDSEILKLFSLYLFAEIIIYTIMAPDSYFCPRTKNLSTPAAHLAEQRGEAEQEEEEEGGRKKILIRWVGN